ncbi:bifunctional 4-hydroxy-2-oxoglutarate aldolase/2-dehydro-3-deoxy-phosphogluconate aldolase [Fusobacterium ulcerans]|uniref:bifunctional 4-hydroxy-2-oxoglutarate aldolase/2-dehydro-3-deoxy-phosphogluconate aldolase n=1 Tax=Fusobacterium ulcerans TaxID=861 RepID=UPI0026717B6D|nr:bifunctional 4-hydroxy-2-oxoglutarate aldolase/2-dehydro-3-deoxy-phosphogluconate aldolase [Fusobacterium ulcerans]
MKGILKKIEKIGIVPVIKLEKLEDAVPLAKALCEGGIPCAEVTFRTDICVDVIKVMKETYPEMIIGAGTVLTKDQVDAAIKAGAEFIVSPGFNPEIVEYCNGKKIIITPGCTTPSDIEQALKLGLEAVKFFPAENAGGIKMIKALSAPYEKLKFMPTGGINIDNIKSYLDFDKVIACGGTWMVPSELIEKKNFEQIKILTRITVENMLGFSLAHIGLNMASSEEAESVVDTFESIFGFKKAENPNSIFAGSYIEAMRSPYLGKNGHIAIFTDYIERAVAYLERNKIKLNQESAKYNSAGKLGAIYLENEIGGFAIHLVQKAK